MRSLSVSFLLLALGSTYSSAQRASSGCGTPSIVPVGTGVFFHIPNTSGGTAPDDNTRLFKVDVPAGYNPNTPVPLIFSFHGRTRTAVFQEELSDFHNPIFNTRAISVYPQGLANQWQGDPRAPTDVNDIDFTTKMLANLTATFCIDESRIYAAGKSNGGGFVNQIACSSLAARFAAFAPVSGAFYTSSTGHCDSSFSRHPTPLFEIHGDADTQIPYEGGNPDGDGDTPSLPDFMAQWAERNECSASTTDTLFAGEVERTRWDCQGHVAVLQHYKSHGLAHDWPATVPNLDNTGHAGYNATREIMEFFNRHSLP